MAFLSALFTLLIPCSLCLGSDCVLVKRLSILASFLVVDVVVGGVARSVVDVVDVVEDIEGIRSFSLFSIDDSLRIFERLESVFCLTVSCVVKFLDHGPGKVSCCKTPSAHLSL